MAGVGRGCPHQSFGQKSCISGGQIDVSCCIDTHFNRACQYRPGLATGVLCCKLPGKMQTRFWKGVGVRGVGEGWVSGEWG